MAIEIIETAEGPRLQLSPPSDLTAAEATKFAVDLMNFIGKMVETKPVEGVQRLFFQRPIIDVDFEKPSGQVALIVKCDSWLPITFVMADEVAEKLGDALKEAAATPAKDRVK
jgi:hypothetical protein